MSHCLPVFKATYAPTDGIYNNDQNNLGCLDNKVHKYPLLELAFISNTKDDNNVDPVILNFLPFCLNWCDFVALFFRSPGGAFNINAQNASSKVISFSEQKYTTVNDKIVRFSLADQIFKAWSKKNNMPESAISPSLRIKLNRESFLLKSLASVNAYQVGLSLDEVLVTLLQNNEIERSDDPDDSAEVHFTITYREYYQPLDITLILNFSYITHIPCYKNVGFCPKPYSFDCTPIRKCLDDETMSVTSEATYAKSTCSTLKEGEHEYYNDDHTLVTNSTNVVSEISKIIYGDNVSQSESTKW